MATLKNGILGGVRGKIGNVVGSSWKGVDYLKTLPATYTDAKTEVQISNRSKFLSVIRFLQPLTDFIRLGYKSQAQGKTAFNAAMSYLYHNAVSGTYPDLVIDFSKVVLSKGSLTGAYNASASASGTNLLLSWADNSADGSAKASDVAMVAVYHPLLVDAYFSLNAAKRSDAGVELQLPQHFSGGEVHVYLSFMALDALGSQAMKSVSNSSYVGMLSLV
jgi:hypothetical protein